MNTLGTLLQALMFTAAMILAPFGLFDHPRLSRWLSALTLAALLGYLSRGVLTPEHTVAPLAVLFLTYLTAIAALASDKRLTEFTNPTKP